MPKPRVKYSYGVALFKSTITGPKMLILKKRCTFYYSKFTLGSYSTLEELRYMFDNMSVSEKATIMTFNFGLIWYKMWLFNPDANVSIFRNYDDENNQNYLTRPPVYHTSKSRFEKLLQKHGIPTLVDLIKNSSSICGIWELPKGHKNKAEKPYDCAIREFEEEICITGDDYRIINMSAPTQFTHVDDGTIYHTFFYVAELTNPEWTAVCSMRKYHYIAETDQLMWVNLDALNDISTMPVIKKQLLKQFAVLKNKYLQYTLYASRNTNLEMQEKGGRSIETLTVRFTKELDSVDCSRSST